MTTTNLADFGTRELNLAIALLTAYCEAKGQRRLDPNFSDTNVQLMMNRHSGNVFLTNADTQVLMLNDVTLEQFFTCSYCGHEGFQNEFLHEPQDEDCNVDMRMVLGEGFTGETD